MQTTIVSDKMNRIGLTKDVRRVAGVSPGQKFKVLVTPGRIVFEVESSTVGRIVKRGKLKLWTGPVPNTSIEEAVEQSRRYSR